MAKLTVPKKPTIKEDRVLVMKPEPREEFKERRVELAYEVKALALALAKAMNEADALKMDVLFQPYRLQDGSLAVNTQVSVRLLL